MVSLPSARQVLHVLGFLLLLAIVIPFMIYTFPAIVGADGGYVVMSGSMEPAIGVGDVVSVDDVLEFSAVATEWDVGSETKGKATAQSASEAEWELDTDSNRLDAVSAGENDLSGESEESL